MFWKVWVCFFVCFEKYTKFLKEKVQMLVTWHLWPHCLFHFHYILWSGADWHQQLQVRFISTFVLGKTNTTSLSLYWEVSTLFFSVFSSDQSVVLWGTWRLFAQMWGKHLLSVSSSQLHLHPHPQPVNHGVSFVAGLGFFGFTQHNSLSFTIYFLT